MSTLYMPSQQPIETSLPILSTGWGSLVPGSTVVINFTDSSANGLLAANSTYRIIATENCHIELGITSDTATTSDAYLAAGVPEVITTGAATNIYLCAIRSTTSGYLYATKLSSSVA